LALAVALAGNAVAEQATTSKVTTKKVKKIGKKQAKKQVNKLAPGIADEQITERAPGLSVAHADTADSADIAQSPVAYAHVNQNGTVDPAHSRGLSNANIVTNPAGSDSGTYCIKGLTGVKSAMVVADSAGGNRHATIRVGEGAIEPFYCANVAGTQFAVSTFSFDTASEVPFFIWFFN
jgi:hypothetical protein